MILVLGGAGYIGSHMVLTLLAKKEAVLVVDDLSKGHRDAVLSEHFVQGDLGDRALLDTIFQRYNIEAVMHFAAFIEVGESVRAPAKYYDNNVVKTKVLLDAMVFHGVRYFIFSSTAAIFGEPEYVPIDLTHPKNPINPYGKSKWMVEQMLPDYDLAYGLKSVCLRYFNAAGADPAGRLSERHQPESHLIPRVLQVARGEHEAIRVFGQDYDTPDGTCIRDYVHVSDLCDAHLLALAQLKQQQHSRQYNLGNGKGFSVAEVIETARQVTGKNIPVIADKRRAGDPARLIADASAAFRALCWAPQFPHLKDIIQHAWQATA